MPTQPLALEPQRYVLDSPYLTIDLSKVRSSIDTLAANSGDYFSRSLDEAQYEVIGEEGVYRKEVSTADVSEVFELVSDTTAQITLRISIAQRTPNLGIKLFPQEFFYFAVDFSRRSIHSSVSILSLEKAQQLWKMIEGVVFVSVQLPQQHRYIESYLYSFLRDHPSTNQNIFLIMRFEDTEPFHEIIEAVRATCAERDLNILRADDKEYTDDLWDNVLTYMYGCDNAIAIFDQINYREFNPNVALEVGFLFAQCKRVLLLKDKAIPVMPADIVGKIYRTFDTYDAKKTIPPQINKWLDDYDIGRSAGAV